MESLEVRRSGIPGGVPRRSRRATMRRARAPGWLRCSPC